jgi:hypothetical protein
VCREKATASHSLTHSESKWMLCSLFKETHKVSDAAMKRTMEKCATPLDPCNRSRILQSIDGQGFEFKHVQRDPKGDDLFSTTVKPWETAVEAGSCTDVQIVCLSFV